MKTGCFPVFLIVLLNLILGTWSLNVILSWFGKSIPMIASLILGVFIGEISIPVAIVGIVLKAFGVF